MTKSQNIYALITKSNITKCVGCIIGFIAIRKTMDKIYRKINKYPPGIILIKNHNLLHIL